MMAPEKRLLLAVALGACLLLAGCSGDDSAEPDPDTLTEPDGFGPTDTPAPDPETETPTPTATSTPLPEFGPPPIDEPIDRSEIPAANATELEILVVRETNERREANDLPPVEYHENLSLVGQVHSRDMAERDFFSHTNPIRTARGG